MFVTFYNGSIRKMVVAFGSLFNQIKIEHTESSGTTTIATSPPPVTIALQVVVGDGAIGVNGSATNAVEIRAWRTGQSSYCWPNLAACNGIYKESCTSVGKAGKPRTARGVLNHAGACGAGSGGSEGRNCQ